MQFVHQAIVPSGGLPRFNFVVPIRVSWPKIDGTLQELPPQLPEMAVVIKVPPALVIEYWPRVKEEIVNGAGLPLA